LIAPSSPSLNVIEKDHRLSGNIDRLQHRPRLSTYTREQENSSPKEENDLLSISPTSNDGIYASKLIIDLNNQTINSNVDSGQTTNSRLSTRRGSAQTSTGEITNTRLNTRRGSAQTSTGEITNSRLSTRRGSTQTATGEITQF